MKKTKISDHILKVVKNISKTTPGGEAFFTAFDAEVTSNKEILSGLLDIVPKNNFVVLTGGFGKRIADSIDKRELPEVPYFLFGGGIRSGSEPTLLRIRTFTDMPVNGVMLDDSIYGGATYKLIKKSFRGFRKVKKCIVVYDGCPVKKKEIVSMFRYYDHFEAKPNFSF